MNISNIDNLRRSTDQISTNQQSAEQTILLNAIRNKFANKNENHSGTSPPVFSIPNLKLPQLSAANSLEYGKSSLPGAFVIPNLQIPNKLNGATLTLAEKLHLDSMTCDSNVISLNKGISDLQISDESKTHVIDLTTALNRKSTLPASPKQHAASITNPIDFQIPFIDCDLRESTTLQPIRDEYCQNDFSAFVNCRFINAPSRFGKITCLKYRLPKLMLRVDHGFKVKHVINRFGFDTKSPDDVILASLRKYTKV